VLLVEDGPDNQILLTTLLQKQGLAVTVAENGREGVVRALQARSAGTPYDLILMDMQMPVMDGYTATRILRSRDKETPVIALTAHAMAPFEQEILDAGCTGYLAKPIDIELLLSTLAEVLGGRRVTVSRLKEANRVPILCDDDRQNPTTPLISLWANDPELHDAARKFADQVPERLLAMEKAWRTRDFTTLSELAHWLKGSGGTAGFPDFTAPARLIEELAQRQALDEVEEVLAEVHKLGRRMAAFYGRDAGHANAA
jgi:CheY-like chemotaxis protein